MFVLHSFLNADFACAAVFISFGAVVDVTTPLQLIVMAICEIALYATNEFIGLEIFQVFAGTHCIGRCPHLSTMLFFRLYKYYRIFNLLDIRRRSFNVGPRIWNIFRLGGELCFAMEQRCARKGFCCL